MKDEFNELKIVNEDENLNFEFGPTPEEESASYSDNSDNLRDELNDNKIENSSNNKKKEEERKKENKNKQENHDNKQSGGHSATSGTVATAGAVAAVAACVVTGIISVGATPLIPEVQNAKFTSHETSIACSFDISTPIYTNKYKIKLSNIDLDFSNEQDCEVGHNDKEFANLKSSTVYTFEVFRGVFDQNINDYSFESIYNTNVSTLDVSKVATISYNSLGREGTMSSIEIDRNSQYTLPPSIFVPRDDEFFSGWKVNGQGEILIPGDQITISGDTTLVAEWTKFPTQENMITADRTFFSNFPEQPSTVVSSVTLMNIEFQYSTVAYSSSDGTLGMYVYDAFISTTTPFAGPIKSITVNSKTVDYDLNMVYSESPIYERVTEGGETKTVEFAQDYTFECTNPDARYFCLSRDNDASGSASFNYIKFVYETPVIENQFSIYFDANGGTGSFGPWTIRDTNKEELPDIEEIGFVAPDGYEFAGWKVKGVEDLLAPGTLVGISSDVTLVAQWKVAPKYTVTFDSNGGSPVDSQIVVKGDQVTRPTDPTRAKYIFLDWYTDEELTNPYNFEDAVRSDLTLIAGWKPDASLLMYINYVDTLSASPANQLSFSYTKTDEYSVFTDFSLELDGETKVSLEVGALDNAETYTTKTISIDSEAASALGTGIVNYIMNGITFDGESYEVATGSLSMSNSQKEYFCNAYIGNKVLQEDNTGETFHVMSVGSTSSSSYYVPVRLEYADYSSKYGDDFSLAYSVDGTTETTSQFYYFGGNAYVSITSSTDIWTDNKATFKTIRFVYGSSVQRQIGDVYQNVTMEVSDERCVSGFRLNNMVDPNQSSKPRSILLIACGDNTSTSENYTFPTLGVNNENFEASLNLRLLSKGGALEKEYNIDLVSALRAMSATSSMRTTNVEFDFIDTISGEDKADEFVELSKRYVVDAKLTIAPGDGSSFVCTSYKSYSFR